MAKREPLIRNISDTARWVAVYRALETEKPNPLFRDPYARRLAGERGEEIARRILKGRRNDWPFTMRTVLFDQYITTCIANGADMVINLAAGLDARPYRMSLPPSLQWVEIDLPEITTYKEGVLANEKPVCALERIKLDLADEAARRAVFERLGSTSKRAVVVSEGLVVYLTTDQVASLARDLAQPASFRHWVVEIASPKLLKMLQRSLGPMLERANAPMQFGPPEGPDYFLPYGWKPVEVKSMFHEAARRKRLPFLMQLLSRLASEKVPARGPWSGALLLERT